MDFSHFIAHLLGDFVIQNDWMAKSKKDSSMICAIHSITYIVPFLFLCDLNSWQLALIAGQHHVQDRDNFVIWSLKKTGKGFFATGPCAPWSIFAVDGTFHLLWIYFVINL